jgi:hypothetical protein
MTASTRGRELGKRWTKAGLFGAAMLSWPLASVVGAPSVIVSYAKRAQMLIATWLATGEHDFHRNRLSSGRAEVLA